MIPIFNWFVKLTGWLPQKLVFRTKILYEDRGAQSRRIHGPAILISNHTSVFDYAALIFVFFGRTLRYQMAEVLFAKQPLGLFLRAMGGIRVDRNARDFGFVGASEDILRKGGVVGIFPESRLPREGEERPLPFKPSAAYLALVSGVPVIPVWTNGRYFTRDRAVIAVGTPFYAGELTDERLSEKENIERVAAQMRRRVIELENRVHEQET